MTKTMDLGLGSGHTLSYVDWDPDLDLNPECRAIAGQLPARVGAFVGHSKPDGSPCEGMIYFDTPIAREHFIGPYWQVESWEPLTLSPSLLCHCGDHGFIKAGKWVTA